MFRKPKTHKIKARALTDPRPAFVSLVKGGANQRPFRAVKMDPEAVAPEVETKQEETSMAKKSINAPEGYDIAMLHFSGDGFQTEDAVKAWLDEGGYVDYQIKAKDDGSFEVENDAVEFEEGTVEKIEGAVSGLTVYAGKVKAEAPAEKSDEEVVAEHAEANPSAVQPVATAKADETAAKADAEVGEEDAAKSDEAADEVSFEDAVKALETRAKSIGEVSDIGFILDVLRWMVEDAEFTGMKEEQVAAIKNAGRELVKAMAGMMDDTIKSFEEAFKSAFKKETPAMEPEATVGTTENEIKDTDEGKEVEAEAAKTEDAPVQEAATETAPAGWEAAVEALSKQIGTLAEATGKVLDEVKAKVDETAASLEDRVKSLEEVGQSRKGADVSAGDSVGDTATAKTDDSALRRLRSALGAPFAADETYRP